MDTDRLETLLSLGRETPAFEVKESAPWSVKFLAKDLLAMANNRDGGVIVIGVEEDEDGRFIRRGVKPEDRATYRADDIRSKFRKFADPPVQLAVDYVRDAQGLEYVVITIASFQRVPVICRSNNNKDVFPGMLYYRTTDGPVQSAPISNAGDMLDLIMSAVQRTRVWVREHGFVPADDDVERLFVQALDDELGGL